MTDPRRGALVLLIAAGCAGPIEESRSLDVLAARARSVAGFHARARAVYEDASRPGTARWEEGFYRIEIQGEGDRLLVNIARHSAGEWRRRTILVRGDEIWGHREGSGGLYLRHRRGEPAPEELDEAYLFFDAHRGYPWLRSVGRARAADTPSGSAPALATLLWLELDGRAFPPGSNYERLRVALDPRDGLPRAVRGGPFPANARESDGLMLERVFTVTSLELGGSGADLRLPSSVARDRWVEAGSHREVTVPSELIAPD